jgi:uncharacterized repeat protein (TIGR01451 family)
MRKQFVTLVVCCSLAWATFDSPTQADSSPHWPSARTAGMCFGLGGADDPTKRAAYEWGATHLDFIDSVDGHYLDYIRGINPTIQGLGRYEVFTSAIEGSSGDQAIKDRAAALGRDVEDAYQHYNRDTLSPGRANYNVSDLYPWLRAEYDPVNGNYKVYVPGWDPANDVNHDGYVDDAEFSHLFNPNATARRKMHARPSTWSWGPPPHGPQWETNLAAFDLVKVLIDLIEADLDAPASWGQMSGFGLVYFDVVDGWFKNGTNTLEYPHAVGGDYQQDYRDDVAALLVYAKERYGDRALIGGNSSKGYWTIDKELDVAIRELFTNTWDTWGQWEGQLPGGRYGPLNPNSAYYQARNTGKMQVLQHQYNLLYYIADTPAVWARDRIFGVGMFYLLQNPGNDYWHAYRGSGYWPTVANNEKMWSRSLEVDIGVPTDSVPGGATALTPWGVWVFAEGADPGHPDYPDITKSRYKVYAREYTNGLVLLKPKSGTDSGRSTFADNTATTHDLGGWYQPVHDDGTLGEPTTSVTLRNGEAAIFVGGQPTAALQATPGAAMPGSDVTYVATCTNPFPDPITNVKVQGGIPAGTTYLDGSAHLVVGGTAVSPLTPQFAPDPDDPSEFVIWVIVNQIPGNGGRAEFEYKVRLDAP